MHFFGKKTDSTLAVDKVHQWLIDTEKSVPESLGDTSIARLSKQASAELNMPQSTTIRALYNLRDSGKLSRIKGTNRKASYAVKPVTTKKVAKKATKIPVKGTVGRIVPPICEIKSDAKCSQKEPKVCVKNDTDSITITIKIEL